MKNINKVLFLWLVVVLGIGACTDMDDYLKYTGGKDLTYTGKVDSVHARAGNNRVVITGLLISDPKITLLKLYWNTRQDSMIMDIERSAGVDSLSIPIELPEGRYNFELITYDAQGNASVTVFSSGSAYGDTYKETLINRPIKSVGVTGPNQVAINLYNGDETSPFTEIIYTDINDKRKVRWVKADEEVVILSDIKNQTKFTYQTYFLPEKLAIDTFKAVTQTIELLDITRAYFPNPGRNFVRGDNGTGKWGTPKDWLYNTAATNQNGGNGGGWSSDDGGVMHFETQDWGGAGVNNGKVWQTFTLPPGNYTVSFETGNYGGDNYSVKELVMAGTELPDVDNLGTPIAVFHGDSGNLGGTHVLNFTLDETTTVAIGWLINTGQYTYLQFRSIKFVVAPRP